MWEMIDRISGYVVPVLSVLSSYALGRLQTGLAEARAESLRSYEGYYRPIVWALYQGRLWEGSFCDVYPYAGTELYTLLSGPVEFAVPRDLYCLDQFVHAFSDAHSNPPALKPSPEALRQVDAPYDRLIIRTLCRSLRLERRLHREQLSRYVLSRYLENPSIREHLQAGEEKLLSRIHGKKL